MKKILAVLTALFLGSVVCMAQAIKKVTVKTREREMKVVAGKPIALSNSVSTTIKQTPIIKKGSVVLKKDGTPDKRYNKTTTTVTLKKDGTPDKRFKNNKKN